MGRYSFFIIVCFFSFSDFFAICGFNNSVFGNSIVYADESSNNDFSDYSFPLGYFDVLEKINETESENENKSMDFENQEKLQTLPQSLISPRMDWTIGGGSSGGAGAGRDFSYEGTAPGGGGAGGSIGPVSNNPLITSNTTTLVGLRDNVNSNYFRTNNNINSLNSRLSALQSQYNTNNTYLNTRFSQTINYINNNARVIFNNKKDADAKFASIESRMTSTSDFFKVFDVDIRDLQSGVIAKYDGLLAQLMKSQTNRVLIDIGKLITRDDFLKVMDADVGTLESGSYGKYDGAMAKLIKAQTTRAINSSENKLDLINGNLKLVNAGVVAGNTSMLLNTNAITAVKSAVNDVEKAVKDMNLKVNANLLLNLHAIDVVRDSVNNLKTDFNNSFKSDNYESGINANDGLFVKAIKGQFSRLISESYLQNAALWNSNGALEENSTDGSFVKMLKKLNYALRYSIIEEFSSFTEKFKLEMLQNRNKLSELVLLINDNLKVVLTWLKLIYEKEIKVTIPPVSSDFVLDYDKFQKMFDGIDFGSITNEAGKNIWDFLSELVKAIADLGVAILGLVDALADKIILLFVPENFDFIDEGFEQISDSFDKKFEFAINIGSDILKIFNVPQVKFSDKSIKVDAFDMNMEIPLQFSLINDFAVYVRGLITAFILIYNLKYIYGRIVGEGDII